MTFTRLPWRIGLPFAAFVLAGSVVLVIWMARDFAADERGQFERLVHTNADFINRARLPPSERMAEQLSEVLGISVRFRQSGVLTPVMSDGGHALLAVSADGVARRNATATEVVALPLHSGADMLFEHPLPAPAAALRHGKTWGVLAAFWLLSIGLAWLVARGLVRPLRRLALKLPEIERPGALELPEAGRRDEIGDVARAFVRTREALQSEREQREQAEKLAVLGRMTAALAHEIQNPVAAIKLHAQLMPASVQGAQSIADEAARIEGMVNQWLFLSKPEPPATAELEVENLITHSLAAHRRQFEHARVEVENETGGGTMIRGDQRRLGQVFSNLIVNAVQAMPHGGVLKVATLRAHGVVEISFADTGKGFSDEARLRFKEFFFSEKEGGMGIGLSVAGEIVKAHGGELLVANRTEGGARVTVRLPVCVL